jgi:nucleotide-binding universal stress UspA family protein
MERTRRHEPSHDPWTDPAGPRRILAATDLGPFGDAAIRVASARAAGPGGRLAVCHVVSDTPDEPVHAARRIAEVHHELTELLAATVGAAASDVDVFVPIGEPARQIHACAEAWDAELVVIGRPDNPGGIIARLFRPGVVDQVVRYSPCAVLVTRTAPGTGRIVVGFDFADPAMTVLRAAAAEQHRTGGRAHVIHCLPPTAIMPIGDPAGGVVPPTTWDEIEVAMHERIDDASRAAGLDADVSVIRDGAASGLVAAARDLAADLVIVGTHGRGRLARIALGSVAQHVVTDAPCPVLVVRLPSA